MSENKSKAFATPEGRVINCSLFEKDTYTDARGNAGTPAYKVEIAFNPDDVLGEGTDGMTLEDRLYDAAEEKWGEGSGELFLAGKIRSPLLIGDKLAERREKRGKPGDAYKGKIVIRAHTFFNKHGENAPGGIAVWDQAVEVIDVVKREEVYPGCFGIVGLTIAFYVDTDDEDEEKNCLMFYLSSFQKTNDGDRLMTPTDTSTLFEARGRPKGEASKKRGRKG